MMYKLRPN